MESKIKLLKELISYGIFGVLTTTINILIFMILNQLNMNYMLSNFIAWVLSVSFAFYTNRKFVFKSDSCTKEQLSKEILAFFGSRIFSLVIDMIFMFLLINMLLVNAFISKLIVNVVVIILNYALSKLFIFKKQ